MLDASMQGISVDLDPIKQPFKSSQKTNIMLYEYKYYLKYVLEETGLYNKFPLPA